MTLALGLFVTSACGTKKDSDSSLHAVIDNSKISLLRYKFNENQDAPLGRDMYVIVSQDSRDAGKRTAFAIDCTGGGSPADVVKAFGLNLGTARPMANIPFDVAAEILKFQENPYLRCSSTGESSSSRQLVQLFHIVQDAAGLKDDQGVELPRLPNYLVRFGRSDTDSELFDESQFYSVGCNNFLTTFASTAQRSQAIPLLASTARKLFPTLSDYQEMNCTDSNTQPIPELSRSSLTVTNSNAINTPNLELMNLIDNDGSYTRVLRNDRSYYKLECYSSVSDKDLMGAFRFETQPRSYRPGDAAYATALTGIGSNPSIRCADIFDPTPFTRAYSTVNSQPAVRYFESQGADGVSLFRFGCESAERFFAANVLQDPKNIVEVSRETMTLPQLPKVHTIPCSAPSWAVTSGALLDGQVVSFKNQAKQQWFDGNTFTSGTTMNASAATGTYWHVSSRADGAVTLRTLGDNPGNRILNCDASGRVFLSDKEGLGWKVYQKNSESAVRLACETQNGPRFLTNQNTVALDPNDSDGTWLITTHRFTEQTNFLQTGIWYTFRSLLKSSITDEQQAGTGQKTFISAFPGGEHDIVNTDISGHESWFQPLKADEQGGLNFWAGSNAVGKNPIRRWLNCVPGKDWTALATNAKDTGSYFKTYAIPGTNFIKLGCGSNGQISNWLVPIKNHPYLERIQDPSRSLERSILWPERRN